MTKEQKEELFGDAKHVPLYYNFLTSKDINDLTYVKLVYSHYHQSEIPVRHSYKPISKICTPIKMSEK